MREFKVVLLGEGCVGKTSIVLRYCQNIFNTAHITTLQATFLSHKLNVNGTRVELNIWDTAGQERYHALGPIYYRNSNGAILVFDITDEDSFNRVKNWVKELQIMLGNDVPLVIVGNKMDMEKDRKVEDVEAAEYAKTVGAMYMKASAKQNKGIEEIFLELTKTMLSKDDSSTDITRRGSRRANRGARNSRTIPIIDDDVAAPQKGGCC